MCPISKTTFKEWQAEQFKDPELLPSLVTWSRVTKLPVCGLRVV